MADLDTAAADLVVQLKGLETQISRAQHQLSELDHQLTTATGHLDADWAAVEERIAALVAKAHEEKGQLADQGEAANHTLTELSTAIHGAQGEQHAALQEGSAAVAGFSEHVAGIEPRVEPLTQAVAAAAQGLAEKAQTAETALGQAFAQARDFLQEQVVSDLHHMQQQIHDSAEHMRSLIAEQETQLDHAFADWSEKLVEVETMLEHAFADAHEHAHDVMEFSMEECAKAEHEESEQLSALLSALEGVLDSLHDEAAEAATDVGEEGKHALDEGLSTIHTEVGSALNALARVKELLAKFSFVSM